MESARDAVNPMIIVPVRKNSTPIRLKKLFKFWLKVPNFVLEDGKDQTNGKQLAGKP